MQITFIWKQLQRSYKLFNSKCNDLAVYLKLVKAIAKFLQFIWKQIANILQFI